MLYLLLSPTVELQEAASLTRFRKGEKLSSSKSRVYASRYIVMYNTSRFAFWFIRVPSPSCSDTAYLGYMNN
jgi:hypothetical protein